MEDKNDYFTDFVLDNEGNLVFAKFLKRTLTIPLALSFSDLIRIAFLLSLTLGNDLLCQKFCSGSEIPQGFCSSTEQEEKVIVLMIQGKTSSNSKSVD